MASSSQSSRLSKYNPMSSQVRAFQHRNTSDQPRVGRIGPIRSTMGHHNSSQTVRGPPRTNRYAEQRLPEGYKPLSHSEIKELLKWLPLPPDPSHPAWMNRCFDCFVVGHRPGACKGYMVCLRCLYTGHASKDCPEKRMMGKGPNDALRPRGNRGDNLMPQDRPDEIVAFVHETMDTTAEIRTLQSMIVVDAHYVTSHTSETVSYDLSRGLNWTTSFTLSHLSNRLYLAAFPPDFSTQKLLRQEVKHLHNLGYVFYLWSPNITSEPINHLFKVWFIIQNLPPFSWAVDQVTKLVGSLGLLLDHSSLSEVHSFDAMNVMLATDKLERIPRAAALIMHGLKFTCPILILSWIQEEFLFQPYPNTLPPNETFERIAQGVFENFQSSRPSSSHTSGSSQHSLRMVENPWPSAGNFDVDVDIIKDVLAKVPPSEAGDYLKNMLDDQSECSRSTENNGGSNSSGEKQVQLHQSQAVVCTKELPISQQGKNWASANNKVQPKIRGKRPIPSVMPSPSPRRSTRVIKPPETLKNYVPGTSKPRQPSVVRSLNSELIKSEVVASLQPHLVQQQPLDQEMSDKIEELCGIKEVQKDAMAIDEAIEQQSGQLEAEPEHNADELDLIRKIEEEYKDKGNNSEDDNNIDLLDYC